MKVEGDGIASGFHGNLETLPNMVMGGRNPGVESSQYIKTFSTLSEADKAPASSPKPCPNHKCASRFETNAMDRLIRALPDGPMCFSDMFIALSLRPMIEIVMPQDKYEATLLAVSVAISVTCNYNFDETPL
jgi:hypothetical protein